MQRSGATGVLFKEGRGWGRGWDSAPASTREHAPYQQDALQPATARRLPLGQAAEQRQQRAFQLPLRRRIEPRVRRTATVRHGDARRAAARVHRRRNLQRAQERVLSSGCSGCSGCRAGAPPPHSAAQHPPRTALAWPPPCSSRRSADHPDGLRLRTMARVRTGRARSRRC